jgi:multiple sugar transport system permease protein
MRGLQRALKRGPFYTVLLFFCLFAALPFLWMLITMFKEDSELLSGENNPYVYNEGPTLEHLDVLWNDTEYQTFVENSLIVGVLVVLITLVLAVPAAYSLARLAGPWGDPLGIGIFLVYLVPPTLLFIPMSRIVAELGLQDSIWALVIVYPGFTVPFCTWLLMGFLKSIPRDIEEQAMVDGYSRLQAIFRTVIPLAVPGLLTVAVFAFALTLHEFIYALSFISASEERTVSVGVPVELVRGDIIFWQSLMAGAVLVAIPLAIVYNFFLDRFIAGFTLGAVKG